MNKVEAQTIMNTLGKKGLSFFFLIDFGMDNIIILSDETVSDEILYNINGTSNYSINVSDRPPVKLSYEMPDITKYSEAFHQVQKELNYGNSFLTNLTWKTKLTGNFQLEDIFYNSSSKYNILYRHKFVVFSPECFIKIKDGQITSFPMKGTIDADLPNAEEIILNDPKEKAEHNTIVDLIRNDLSIVADNVRLKRFRYTELVKNNNKNLLQVSSEIVGDLPDNYSEQIGDLIFNLLPAGSISGAPKKKTVEIITSVEQNPRGFYTGIGGYFDGRNLDSCVLIRYIAKEGHNYYYHSGGGITYRSNLDSEFQEMLQKIYVPTS